MREQDLPILVRPSTEARKRELVKILGEDVRRFARAIHTNPSPLRVADSLMGADLRLAARALRIVAATPIQTPRR